MMASSSSGLNASGSNNNSNMQGPSRGRLITPHKSPGRNRHLLPLPTSAMPASPAKCNMSSTDYLTLTASSSASKRKLTPGRDRGGTPGRGGATPMAGDRFIPVRAAMDLDRAKFRLLNNDLTEEDKSAMSPGKREYQKFVRDTLDPEDPTEGVGGSHHKTRILQYNAKKPPEAPDSHANGLKVLYSSGKAGAVTSKKHTRHIPQVPERILDAPEIVNDYYLNLVDWSSSNLLAVALAGSIYLWNAGTGNIMQLMELENADDYVTSVKWLPASVSASNCCLAVGDSSGSVSIWDAERLSKVRTMRGHSDRVGCLAWNKHILSSGCKSGKIHHSDVRVADHLVGISEGHVQEVCGLAWSPDGRFLASGGNDNTLFIWEDDSGSCYPENSPKYEFSDHQAAVKALAWCPWQPGILASGGGTADRFIRIWNCNSGMQLNAIDTKSQVCSLLWSPEYKELVSAHGYANNEIVIWKYPSMVKTAELMGHSERVLHLSLSPDGTTLISAGGDETLRLWKCFEADPKRKKDCKTRNSVPHKSSLVSRGGIR